MEAWGARRHRWTSAALIILLAPLAVELALQLISRVQHSWHDRQEVRRVLRKGSCRVLWLGGALQAERTGVTPAEFLQQLLDTQSSGIEFEIIDETVSSVSTERLALEIGEHLAQHEPDVVMLTAGLGGAGDELTMAELPPLAPPWSRARASLVTYGLLRPMFAEAGAGTLSEARPSIACALEHLRDSSA